jgi:V8-like Glu-specific endopeptidase
MTPRASTAAVVVAVVIGGQAGTARGLDCPVPAEATETAPGGGPGEGCAAAALRTDLGRRLDCRGVDLVARAAEDKQPWVQLNLDQAHRWVRLELRVVGQGPWSLAVRDPAFRALESHAGDAAPGGDALLTGRLAVPPGGFPHLFLDVEATPGTRIELDHQMATRRAVDERAYYSIVRETGSVPWVAVAPAVDGKAAAAGTVLGDKRRKRAADAVGLLMPSDGSRIWGCTAVAVGPDVLLTARHCGDAQGRINTEDAWHQRICDGTATDLSFDGDENSAEWRCVEAAAGPPELDFALLRVKPLDARRALRPAKLAPAAPAVGADLFVVHHPAAEPKRASQGCHVVRTLDGRFDGGDRFAHDCATAPGSSGAPVFDAIGHLVGLHHHGFDREEKASCPAKDKVNKAIRIEAIRRHIDEALNPERERAGKPPFVLGQ